MPFTMPHLLLNLSGPLRGGERWSMGLRLARPLGAQPPQVDMPALVSEFDTIVSSWFNGGQGAISSAATLDLVKLNVIGTDGLYLYDTSYYVEKTTPLSPGIAATTHPNQVCLVGTLRTAATRGLAVRGRIFLPAPAYAVGTDGLISTANQTNAVTAMKNLVNALNGNSYGASVAIMSKVGSGQTRIVTEVAVGRALDTLRSRRHALPENPASDAVTVVGSGGPF